MKIGVEGLVFQDIEMTGIGKFYLSVLEYLYERNPEVVFVVFTNKPLKSWPAKFTRSQVIIDSRPFQYIKYLIWLKLFAGKLIGNFSIDLFFSSNVFFPKLSDRIVKVNIVHDFNYLLVPKTMPFTTYLAHKFFTKRDSGRADISIVNSHGTKEKALQYLKCKSICKINPPVDPIFKQRDAISVSNYLNNINVNFPYILSVATLEPRKNIDKVILATRKLIDEGVITGTKLLLVGGKGWKNKKSEILIKKNIDFIVHYGYATNEELAYLYNGAKLFVFPSLYEGFGMPVREALYSGCKVVTSNMSELIEASNGLASYVNPIDVSSIKNGIENAWKSEINLKQIGNSPVELEIFNEKITLLLLR